MLALIQNSSSLVYIWYQNLLYVTLVFNLEETKGGPSDDEALYSSLAMLTKDGHFTLCVGDDIRTYKSLKSQSPQTKPPLSEICLTCSHSEISRVNWKNFFQTYNEIKSFSEECGEFDDRCDALLSFLDSVPGLKEVDLKVIRVTENWATRMLSLMQTCPSLQHIGVVTDAELPKRDSVEECLCVSLSMSNRNGDFTLSIEGRGWIRSVFMGFSSAKSLSPQTKSSLSRISLTCPHSQISTIRWTGFLRTFNKVNGLTESCEKFDEQFNALLSFLNSVPGLKKVDLNVNILSKSWATRTLDLIQTCPSLQDIRLAAGFGGKGLLLEEGIKLLQESEKGPDCTLTLDGWRCTKPSDQCTGEEDWNLYCNQRVKLQICGQTCTEECLT
ncbi:uncharacterized protein LOC115811252 [Chanos chanos]|uniref:Uncharacterized protein LOC115811252 n=1 Tax=Chanos chanos TaxID=29144 RepID=A0A6J2VBF4_CHACN|nr:uncharacterized protein LOC115811252 [Chanos chanos]